MNKVALLLAMIVLLSFSVVSAGGRPLSTTLTGATGSRRS